METAAAASPPARPAPSLHSLSYPDRLRVRHPVGGPSLTKQEFQDEADINKIVRRYQLTGALSHFANYAPEYGDFSPCDLQTAKNLLNRASKMFADLPANIRQEFPTPEAFLLFVQNPSNAKRMEELGLTARQTVPDETAGTPATPPKG